MGKMRCLIVDDEELGRLLVEKYLLQMGMSVVGQCRNPMEALPWMHSQQIDLLFLDIQMPEMNDIQFLKTLAQRPMVILTTAYPEHALESYALDVVDYLLKPIRFERFALAVNKATERLQNRQDAAMPMENAEKGILLVRSEHRIHRVRLAEIIYIQSMSEYVSYHFAGSRILSLGSLRALEEELPIAQFIRVHKSYIVNLEKIDFLDGPFLQVGKDRIPVGPSYRDQLLAHFQK